MSNETTEISSDGVQQKYFTQIPNMALYDLSASAYKLLAVYLDMTDIGIVQAQSKTILSRLGMSTNAMKKARQELADSGYIQYAKGEQGKGKKTTLAKVVININWMWAENLNRKGRLSESDTPLSESDNIEQEPIKQELKDIAPKETALMVQEKTDHDKTSNKVNKPDELGKAYGVMPVGGDYGLYGKVCKALTHAGIEPSDYSKYVQWIKQQSKLTGNWKVTIPSLISNGRLSEYIAIQKNKSQLSVVQKDVISVTESHIQSLLGSG
jgi:hypothetical protein